MIQEQKCQCGGKLMPLWNSSKWFCTVCKLEQNLSKEKKPVDSVWK